MVFSPPLRSWDIRLACSLCRLTCSPLSRANRIRKTSTDRAGDAVRVGLAGRVIFCHQSGPTEVNMAACDACGTTILFGGVRDGDTRFCNQDCHANGYLALAARQIPADLIRQQADAVHHGMCPRCEGPGPVDVHTSYRVWSLLLLTSWKSRPQIACRRCGVKSQVGDALLCLFLGWWGFPWGLLVTPVQVARNIAGIVRSKPPGASPELRHIVGLEIAADALQRQASSLSP